MASATRMPAFQKGFMPNAHRQKLERKKNSDLLQQLDSLVPGKGHTSRLTRTSTSTLPLPEMKGPGSGRECIYERAATRCPCNLATSPSVLCTSGKKREHASTARRTVC